MTIVDLKAQPISQWRQAILDNYEFLPYWWIRGVTSESRKALMGQALDEALSANDRCLVGCTSNKKGLIGFSQMRRLEWDTNHFGLEIWRLDHLGTWGETRQKIVTQELVEGSLWAANIHGCQSIQARIPVDNLAAVHALEDVGFRTMEVLTTWVFDLTQSSIPSKTSPEMVRDFTARDTEALIKLARRAYTPTPDRFHMDPRLSLGASDDLYAEWMRNSCSGQLADHVAVAESGGETIGYSTMKYHGNHNGLCNAWFGELGLGAVSPGCRNRGLVTDVVIHQLEWLRLHRGDYCFVGTQGNNIPPQRVWLKIGFKPATMSVTLHHWRDN